MIGTDKAGVFEKEVLLGLADAAEKAKAAGASELKADRLLQSRFVNQDSALIEALQKMGESADGAVIKATHARLGDASKATTDEDLGSDAVMSALKASAAASGVRKGQIGMRILLYHLLTPDPSFQDQSAFAFLDQIGIDADHLRMNLRRIDGFPV